MPRTGLADHHGTYADADIMDRAKAECGLSNRLYNLLIEYQERFQTTQPPYHPAEKVGQLNLPLSRLYNELWHLLIEAPAGDRARRQVEVKGYKRRGRKAA
jgi:hypothetical protein